MDPVASTQTNVTVVDLVDTVGHPKRRRLRKRKTAAQTVDGRRSFDGSLLIPHDDIFYGHSGWTHFELRHPLMRSSHQDTVQAILATDVGTHFGESIQLEEFDALVQTMWQQHRQFRYSQVSIFLQNRTRLSWNVFEKIIICLRLTFCVVSKDSVGGQLKGFIISATTH